MAFDERRGKVVLYGGFGNATALQDTWEYDGNDWTQVATAGPARSTEAFALEVSDDAAQFVPNAGTFTASFGIPNQPALAGAQVISQAFVFEPLAPSGLGVTSRAMHAVLGR